MEAAKAALHEAVALAHKVGKTDRRSEIRLALARYNLGDNVPLDEIADRFSSNADPSLYLPLALAWKAVGANDKAAAHALAAYKWAWGDGDPYSHRYECEYTGALLSELGTTLPEMPPFDANLIATLPWEAEIAHAIADGENEQIDEFNTEIGYES